MLNDKRLVCECYNITVGDIREEIRKGAECFEDIEGSIRLGVMCSACVNDGRKVTEELIREERKAQG